MHEPTFLPKNFIIVLHALKHVRSITILFAMHFHIPSLKCSQIENTGAQFLIIILEKQNNSALVGCETLGTFILIIRRLL